MGARAVRSLCCRRRCSRRTPASQKLSGGHSRPSAGTRTTTRVRTALPTYASSPLTAFRSSQMCRYTAGVPARWPPHRRTREARRPREGKVQAGGRAGQGVRRPANRGDTELRGASCVPFSFGARRARVLNSLRSSRPSSRPMSLPPSLSRVHSTRSCMASSRAVVSRESTISRLRPG